MNTLFGMIEEHEQSYMVGNMPEPDLIQASFETNPHDQNTKSFLKEIWKSEILAYKFTQYSDEKGICHTLFTGINMMDEKVHALFGEAIKKASKLYSFAEGRELLNSHDNDPNDPSILEPKGSKKKKNIKRTTKKNVQEINEINEVKEIPICQIARKKYIEDLRSITHVEIDNLKSTNDHKEDTENFSDTESSKHSISKKQNSNQSTKKRSLSLYNDESESDNDDSITSGTHSKDMNSNQGKIKCDKEIDDSDEDVNDQNDQNDQDNKGDKMSESQQDVDDYEDDVADLDDKIGKNDKIIENYENKNKKDVNVLISTVDQAKESLNHNKKIVQVSSDIEKIENKDELTKQTFQNNTKSSKKSEVLKEIQVETNSEPEPKDSKSVTISKCMNPINLDKNKNNDVPSQIARKADTRSIFISLDLTKEVDYTNDLEINRKNIQSSNDCNMAENQNSSGSDEELNLKNQENFGKLDLNKDKDNDKNKKTNPEDRRETPKKDDYIKIPKMGTESEFSNFIHNQFKSISIINNVLESLEISKLDFSGSDLPNLPRFTMIKLFETKKANFKFILLSLSFMVVEKYLSDNDTDIKDVTVKDISKLLTHVYSQLETEKKKTGLVSVENSKKKRRTEEKTTNPGVFRCFMCATLYIASKGTAQLNIMRNRSYPEEMFDHYKNKDMESFWHAVIEDRKLSQTDLVSLESN